ncbi:MAG: hypothetical protein V1913_14075, partial [Fibrobacterota bacterium]
AVNLSAYSKVKVLHPVLLNAPQNAMDAHVHKGRGTGTLFVELCEWLKKKRIKTYTLDEYTRAVFKGNKGLSNAPACDPDAF